MLGYHLFGYVLRLELPVVNAECAMETEKPL